MRDEIINVYSSSGALIASFDNSIVDNAENQKEKIYNPHISVDEDNSTATFEIFKDSNVWRTISSESEIYEIDGRRYFIYGEPSQISDDNLIRVTLKEIWNELDTQYVQAYNVKGDLEYIAEYTVSLVPFGGYPLVINGVEKTNPFTRDNLGYYIWALLQGTGYSIAQCNEEYCCDVVDSTYDEVNLLSAFQLETEGLSVLENLKQLKELTDCIFKWDTVNKTLAVYDRNLANSEQNKWQGYEIREGVNLKSIEKRKNTNITTRVIPYGSDNLTIASVNNELLYLTDTSYSSKIYAKIINNPDIESPQVLKSWAEKELNKMCRPTVEYEVDFVKRTDGEYDVESFNLYDIVRVVYFDKESNAEVVDDQRIISLNYELWKESAFAAKLGDKHMRWEQKLKQSIKNSKKAGTVINSSGIISTGNIVHGKGTDKKYLDKVVESVYTSIGEIDAKADENGAYVNLLALYANDTQGIKSAPTDTDKTLWNTLYTYYAIDSQMYYKFNSTTRFWEETKPINASLAQITSTADTDRAKINLLAEWQGGSKNKLNTNRNTEFNINRNPDEPIQFTEKMVIKGISFNGYIKSENINSYTMGTGTLSFSSANYSYGIGFPLKVLSGEKYVISANSSGIGFHVHFANANCMPISYVMGVSSFTVPNNAEWAVIIFVPSGSLNTTLTATNIQLEFGDISTGYAEYKESAIKSIADVTQQADANGAKIGLITEYSNTKGIREEENYDPIDWMKIMFYYVETTAKYYKYNTTTSSWEIADDIIRSLAKIEIKADKNGSKIDILAEEVTIFGDLVVKGEGGSTYISGNTIQTGIIQSKTYVAGSGNYSTDGMQISLDGKGYIKSKHFAIDGGGNAYFKGHIEAASGEIASWLIYTGAIISSADGDPNDITAFHINSYKDSSENWLEAHNRDGVKTFSISKKGEAELASGYIGSSPTKRWTIGSTGLYYGINSLSDSTRANGTYIGADGIRNQKFHSFYDDTWEQDIIYTNNVILNDGMIKLQTQDLYPNIFNPITEGFLETHQLKLSLATYGETAYESINEFFITHFANLGVGFILNANPRISLGYDGINELNGTWYCKGDLINGSDRKLKNSIDNLPVKFETMFDNLQPKMFKYNEGTSNRLHTGFIVDEVQSAMTTAGITEKEFAAVCTQNIGTEKEVSGLRYSEFISINTWQIQKLKTRINMLEQRVTELENK